jgi:hypothetical protein
MSVRIFNLEDNLTDVWIATAACVSTGPPGIESSNGMLISKCGVCRVNGGRSGTTLRGLLPHTLDRGGIGSGNPATLAAAPELLGGDLAVVVAVDHREIQDVGRDIVPR